MLFEITPIDYWYLLYGAVAGAVIILLGLGAIAGAIKSIRGDIISPLDARFFAPKRERSKKIDELIKSVEQLTTTSEEIKAEVKTNGGSSLKDAINRIDGKVNRIDKSTDYTSSKLRHLDQVSPDAIFEMDIDDDNHVSCIFVNSALCELVNAKESELLDRNWITKVVQTQQKRVQDEWTNAVENSCPLDSVQMIKFSSRETIQIRVQATPRANRDGKLRGFFGRVVKHCE